MNTCSARVAHPVDQRPAARTGCARLRAGWTATILALQVAASVTASEGVGLTDSKPTGRVNVRDFGAIGDGVADDTGAFKAALAAIPSGGVVFVPVGKYRLTDELRLHSGVIVEGSGNPNPHYGQPTGLEVGTYLWQASPGKAIFTLGERTRDVIVRQMTLSAVQTPTANVTFPVPGKYGIRAQGAAPNSSFRFRFEHLTFFNFERGISAVGLADTDWQFDNVRIVQCGFFNNTYGIYISTANADYWTVDTCWFGMPWTSDGRRPVSTAGIYLDRAGFIKVVNSAAGPAPDGVWNGSAFAPPNPQAYDSDFLRVHGFVDNLILDTCQAESVTTFVHVDGTGGYENDYNPITCINCIVEAPVKIERQYRWNSVASRYTHSVLATGNGVHIESFSDTWDVDYAHWDPNREFLPITPATSDISGDGSLVTVSYPDHGFVQDDYIVASGSSIKGYNAGAPPGRNGGVRLIYIDADHFAYAGHGTGTPATAPTISRVSRYRIDPTKSPTLHQYPARLAWPYAHPLTRFAPGVASDRYPHQAMQGIDNDGYTVRLSGRVIANTGKKSSRSIIAYLDPEFRPDREVIVPVSVTASGVGTITIQPDGSITCSQDLVATGNRLVLDGVTFRRNSGR